jgi:hypothetical protein
MRRLLTPVALAALTLALTATSAVAKTSSVGSSSGTPTANICALSFECTYVNFAHGAPSDVVRQAGTLREWSLNAGSVGGEVQLRILRRVKHGQLDFVRSSSWETIANAGENTFTSALKVKAGDVLAVTNSSSGIYMSAGPSGVCVRYFDAAVTDGTTGRLDRVAPRLHLLVSATVTS